MVKIILKSIININIINYIHNKYIKYIKIIEKILTRIVCYFCRLTSTYSENIWTCIICLADNQQVERKNYCLSKESYVLNPVPRTILPGAPFIINYEEAVTDTVPL